jgi:hypothetical protein
VGCAATLEELGDALRPHKSPYPLQAEELACSPPQFSLALGRATIRMLPRILLRRRTT